MFVNSNGDINQARKQAQANANQTGVPWVIFTDTSGNYHAERQSTGPKNPDVIREVIHPETGK